MKVKTRSVEAAATIGKSLVRSDEVSRPHGFSAGISARLDSARNAGSGMQNRELTMFGATVIVIWFREFIQACCVLWFFREGVCREITAKL